MLGFSVPDGSTSIVSTPLTPSLSRPRKYSNVVPRIHTDLDLTQRDRPLPEGRRLPGPGTRSSLTTRVNR